MMEFILPCLAIAIICIIGGLILRFLVNDMCKGLDESIAALKEVSEQNLKKSEELKRMLEILKDQMKI